MDIFKATKQGDLDIVITLIKESRVDINCTDTDERTALHYAALKGYLNIVRAFIQFGAEIDAKDRNNITPLWLATVFNHQYVIIELLKYGADPNATNQAGNSALHIAASNNNLAIVKLLIEYGGNVNSVNNFNWSIFHSAAFGVIESKGTWEVIEYLLKHNVNYLVKDNDGVSVRDLFYQEGCVYARYYDKILKNHCC